MSVTVTLSAPGQRARWIAAGALAGLLAASLAGPALAPRSTVAVDASPSPEHTISVSGTGRVVLVPDTADLRIGVSITRTTVKLARAAAADVMNRVIAALRKAGIAERDIQTSLLSLSPAYDYGANVSPPRIVGYQLTNVVAVTVRDLDILGPAIDDGLAAGATSLDGVTFRVADSAKAEADARKAAMADAKAKADTLAAAAGVSIVGLSSISETVAPIPYPVPWAGYEAGAPKGTPVQPGTMEVSVTVAVVYRIG